MLRYVDLHCHYLPAVDDGVRSVDESVALLRGLRGIGFDKVVATPHMRPALFDNRAPALRSAFFALQTRLAEFADLPETSLAAEHFFDDTVFSTLMRGDGLPYDAGRSVLVEFALDAFPTTISARFFDLRSKRLRPVVAHPERYAPIWKDARREGDMLRRAGGVLLLDVAAIVGKYGAQAQRAAERLVEDGAYYAACSDAHRPADVEDVGRGITRLGSLAGKDEVTRLLCDGPREILEGRILDSFD